MAPGLPIANRRLVQLCDRYDFPGGAGNPDLIRLTQFCLGDFPFREGQGMLSAQFYYQVAGDAAQNGMIFWWGNDHTVVHDEDIAGGAFGDETIVQQNGFHGTGRHGLLTQQAVGQQRDGFDVTAGPTGVIPGDCLAPAGGVRAVGGGHGNGTGHHENGGGNRRLGKGMIAFCGGAPSDL